MFVLQIDLYPVHTSEEFRKWLYKVHPNARLVYVPGGTIGLCQVADTTCNRCVCLSIGATDRQLGAAILLQQLAGI